MLNKYNIKVSKENKLKQKRKRIRGKKNIIPQRQSPLA